MGAKPPTVCQETARNFVPTTPGQRFMLETSGTQATSQSTGIIHESVSRLGEVLFCDWEDQMWSFKTGFEWADVEGICGFWDGSCRANGCGAGMWVKCLHMLSVTIRKTCEPVLGANSLDAEICGCSMLIASMENGSTNAYVNATLSHLRGAYFVGMLCTRVGRNRAPHPGFVLWASIGSGVRCF